MQEHQQRSFLLSLEKPLQNSIQSSINWLVSWIPQPIRSTVTYYTESTITALADFSSSLPVQNALPLAWEAPLRDGPDYWAAHCSALIEEILETSPVSAKALHKALVPLHHCIGPGALSPWVLDRGLRALQWHYITEGEGQKTEDSLKGRENDHVIPAWKQESRSQGYENDKLAEVVIQHRSFLRDQLLKNPQETIPLLNAELQHAYTQQLQGKNDWEDVLDIVSDYARVLPPDALQSIFQKLQQALNELHRKGQYTEEEYQIKKEYLQQVKAQLQGISAYQIRGIQFDDNAKIETPSYFYYSAFLSGLTRLLTIQTLGPSMTLLTFGSWLPSTWAQNQPSSCDPGSNTALVLNAFNTSNAINAANSVWGYPTVSSMAATSQGWIVAFVDSGGIYGQQYANNGTIITPKFPITDQTANPSSPVIASLPGGDCVVVWQSQDGSGYGVFQQRYSTNGSRLDEKELPVNTVTQGNQGQPAVAVLKEGGWVIVWMSHQLNGPNYEIVGRTYAANGSAVEDKEFAISAFPRGNQANPDVAALDGGGWFVTWASYGQDGSGYGIVGRRYANNGSPINQKEFLVNTFTSGNQDHPSITALNDGGYIIVWESDGQNAPYYSVYGRRYNANGLSNDDEFQINMRNDVTFGYYLFPQTFSLLDGGYIVTWQCYFSSFSFGLLGRRYNAGDQAALTMDWGGQWVSEFFMTVTDLLGVSYANAMPVNGISHPEGWLISLAIPSAANTNSYAMFIQFYQAQGMLAASTEIKFNEEVRINTYFLGDQSNPKIVGLLYGGWVAVWKSYAQDGSRGGIYGQQYAANGLPIGSEFRVNNYTKGSQQLPAVGKLKDDGWAVVWTSYIEDGSDFEVYGQRYNANGSESGNEFPANTFTKGYQIYPVVAGVGNDGWIVVWQSQGQDGSGYGIYGQWYAANGSRISTEFPVNTFTKGDQTLPAVAVIGDDSEVVVVWQSQGQDGSGYGIYGQRLGMNGSRIAAEFRVNVFTKGNQIAPAIARLRYGGWVVVWASEGQDDSGFGVYGQQFAMNGSRVGSEFQLNTFTDNDQDVPAVAGLNDGGWIVGWESYEQDGSGYGVYGQRFAKNGSHVGREFLVNTYIQDSQGYPCVAALTDGGWVFAWNSNGEKSEFDVYSQRYTASGHRISMEIPVAFTDTLSADFWSLDLRSQARLVSFAGNWRWVWEEAFTSAHYPGVIAQNDFRTIVYTDYGNVTDSALNGTPCFSNLSRVCLQPWQILSLSSNYSLLLWGDGYCQDGYSALTVQLLGAHLFSLQEQVLEEQVPVDINYIAYPLSENDFLLAWNPVDSMNITLVHYKHPGNFSWIEQARWIIPVSVQGKIAQRGLLINLQLIVNPWDHGLLVMGSVRNDLTVDHFDRWVGVFPYDAFNQTWTFATGFLLDGGDPGAQEQKLQLIPTSKNNYVGVWQANSELGCLFDIYVGLYQTNGNSQPFTLISPVFQVNEDSQGQQYFPQATWSNVTSRLFIAWVNQPNPAWQLKMGMGISYQLLDEHLTPLLQEQDSFGMTAGITGSPASQGTCGFLPDSLQVTSNLDGGFLVTWFGDQYCNGSLQGYVRRLDLNGQVTPFQQTMTVATRSFDPSPYNLTYLENGFFALPANLLTVYTPAGNVTIKLFFTVSNATKNVLNAYAQPAALTIVQQPYSSFGAEWWIHGHFYDVNQAWNQIYWTPAADFYGDSGSLYYQVEDTDGATSPPTPQRLPLVLEAQHVNQAPRATGGQIPRQFAHLQETFSVDMTTIIYDVDDVDNAENTLLFGFSQCLQGVSSTDVCNQLAQNTTVSHCAWLTLKGNILSGKPPGLGDWCIALSATDPLDLTSLFGMEMQVRPPTAKASNTDTTVAIAASAGSLLLLAGAGFYARKRYLADNARTRAYKDQLIRAACFKTLEAVKACAFDVALDQLKKSWGEKYLRLGEKGQHYPTVYISAADNDHQGRAWLIFFLIPNLSALGIEAHLSPSYEEANQIRVLDDTTFFLVLGSADYLLEENTENHQVIQQFLENPQRSHALLPVVRPMAGAIEEVLPTDLQASAIHAPSHRDIDLLFLLIYRLYALDAEVNHETIVQIEALKNQFYDAQDAIERKTRLDIETLMREQIKDENPVSQENPGRNRFGLFTHHQHGHRSHDSQEQGTELVETTSVEVMPV